MIVIRTKARDVRFNEIPDAVAFAHEEGSIESVKADTHAELIEFIGTLDVVDAVFRTVTRIESLDNPF